jgi:[acyl-carrier-protein] S-malonyltransferase
MQPAAEAMAAALDKVTIAPPAVPVFANVSTSPTQIPSEIRALLVQQVTGRVRWRETILAMHTAGAARFVEVGAGKVLAGMIKRIAPEAEALSLNEPGELEAFAKGV